MHQMSSLKYRLNENWVAPVEMIDTFIISNDPFDYTLGALNSRYLKKKISDAIPKNESDKDETVKSSEIETIKKRSISKPKLEEFKILFKFVIYKEILKLIGDSFGQILANFLSLEIFSFVQNQISTNFVSENERTFEEFIEKTFLNNNKTDFLKISRAALKESLFTVVLSQFFNVLSLLKNNDKNWEKLESYLKKLVVKIIKQSKWFLIENPGLSFNFSVGEKTIFSDILISFLEMLGFFETIVMVRKSTTINYFCISKKNMVKLMSSQVSGNNYPMLLKPNIRAKSNKEYDENLNFKGYLLNKDKMFPATLLKG
jgi:hypothetical protein